MQQKLSELNMPDILLGMQNVDEIKNSNIFFIFRNCLRLFIKYNKQIHAYQNILIHDSIAKKSSTHFLSTRNKI